MSTLDRRSWLRLTSSAVIGGSLLPLQRAKGQVLPWPAIPPVPTAYPYTNLSINENQFGPSPLVRDAILKAAPYAHEYPDIPRAALTAAIANRYKVTDKHVLIGAGSADILYGAGYYFGLQGGEIVSADPSFHILSRLAEKHGSTLKFVRHTSAHAVDLNALKEAVTPRTKLVYICNPENPTGTLLPPAELTQFCKEISERCAIVIDEAYIDYAGDAARFTMAPLVEQGYPVVITRTFSKAYGLGGMRIGYALSSPEVANGIGTQYVTGIGCGASRLSIEAALAAYNDTDYIKKVYKHNRTARDTIETMLRDFGLSPIPSSAGFVLVPVSGNSKALADGVFAASQVKISPRNYYGQNYLRISTGRPDQLEHLKEGLRLVLSAI